MFKTNIPLFKFYLKSVNLSKKCQYKSVLIFFRRGDFYERELIVNKITSANRF